MTFLILSAQSSGLIDILIRSFIRGVGYMMAYRIMNKIPLPIIIIVLVAAFLIYYLKSNKKDDSKK